MYGIRLAEQIGPIAHTFNSINRNHVLPKHEKYNCNTHVKRPYIIKSHSVNDTVVYACRRRVNMQLYQCIYEF